MKNMTFAGIVSGAMAVAAIGLAAPALAENGGTVALPGPVSVYPQYSVIGGADPLVPFGPSPAVPFGVWNQN